MFSVANVHDEDVPTNTTGNGCKRVLWFMGTLITTSETTQYFNYAKVALSSALRHAPSLVPILIVDGEPSADTAWFERRGAKVIFHKLSLADAILKAVKDGLRTKDLYEHRGTFLRMDISAVLPAVQQHFADQRDIELEYFLYTDNDILFLTDITTCSLGRPTVIAIGPEHVKGVPHNTGVMYVNASAIPAIWEGMVELAVANDWKFNSMFQGIFLSYVKLHSIPVTLLPDKYNWKGYWGSPNKENEDATAIFHFHGPKPERCLPCYTTHPIAFVYQCARPAEKCNPYRALLRMCPDQGQYYKDILSVYHQFKQEAVDK